MSESIRQALMSEHVDARLEAIPQLQNVVMSERESLFELILTDFSCDVRKSAAASISSCPSMYKRFLADPVPGVRIAVVQQSVPLREVLGNPITVLSELATLTKDPVADVRCAFARVLHQHARPASTFDSREFTLTKIAPILQELLHDNSDDVKLAAASNFVELTSIHGFQFVFGDLRDHIQLILTDRQWRVRQVGIQLLVALGIVADAPYVTENLMMFYVRFLSDPCQKLREFMVAALPSLARQLGEDWVTQSLILELRKLEKSPNFLNRKVYLLALSVLVSFFPVDFQANYVFHPMIRMLKDPVQNVVLLAIELLWQNHELIHPFRRQHEMRPILEWLMESSGPTVTEKAAAFLLECQL
jgi:hypothetical protein